MVDPRYLESVARSMQHFGYPKMAADIREAIAEIRELRADLNATVAMAVPYYTSERPTAPGWYWVRDKSGRTGAVPSIRYLRDGNGYGDIWEFAGPIPAPPGCEEPPGEADPAAKQEPEPAPESAPESDGSGEWRPRLGDTVWDNHIGVVRQIVTGGAGSPTYRVVTPDGQWRWAPLEDLSPVVESTDPKPGAAGQPSPPSSSPSGPGGEPGERVNHPARYNSLGAACLDCGRPIECIDVVRHFGFNVGNVIKYCWRAGLKGDRIEDLRKAAFYLGDEIGRLRGQKG